MYTVAIRGATTVNGDCKEEIVVKTNELIAEIISRNNLVSGQCVSVVVSTTSDIHSFYPVRAIRESGLLPDVPLFSCIEPEIYGALPLCIRVMITANCEQLSTEKTQHVYLHGAEKLRPDLANK